MAVSAVKASPLPISACGERDGRMQVDPMTSPPYSWICVLTIESFTGKRYVGSGFKIHLPGVNRTVVVTSGHCTYIKDNGAFANKITVKFPGRAPIEVGQMDLYASPDYVQDGNADYDYALILLPGPGDCDEGFGWSACVDDIELNNRIVTNCGYPADKPPGSMWITGGKILEYTSKRIFYMNDMYSGESGSPVYTWHSGSWTVLGVHSYGGCPNSAPRFTREMISRFLWRMNCLTVKCLRSVPFPDVYLRCDGSGMTNFESEGGGTVNCQYKPPRTYEKFYIYPVEMTPSLVEESTCKVVIQSVQWENIFIRLDSKGLSQSKGSGGGVVNCQFTAHNWEVFIMRKEPNGSYSFRSNNFPHCYIRLDGTGVTSWTSSGGGTVNCQYYENQSTAVMSWETFHVEEC